LKKSLVTFAIFATFVVHDAAQSQKFTVVEASIGDMQRALQQHRSSR